MLRFAVFPIVGRYFAAIPHSVRTRPLRVGTLGRDVVSSSDLDILGSIFSGSGRALNTRERVGEVLRVSRAVGECNLAVYLPRVEVEVRLSVVGADAPRLDVAAVDG